MVRIPKEHHRFVLGQKGKKLSELELATATKISVPRATDASLDIMISGTRDGIDRARHEIQLISDEQVCQPDDCLPPTTFSWKFTQIYPVHNAVVSRLLLQVFHLYIAWCHWQSFCMVHFSTLSERYWNCLDLKSALQIIQNVVSLWNVLH